MLIRRDKSRPSNLYIKHVEHAGADSAVRVYRTLDRTTGNLLSCFPDQCAEMGILCCGTHWNASKNSIRAFSSCRIRAKTRIGRLSCTSHEANVYKQLFDRREYAGMDIERPVDIQNHRLHWRIDIQPLWILKIELQATLFRWNFQKFANFVGPQSDNFSPRPPT